MHPGGRHSRPRLAVDQGALNTVGIIRRRRRCDRCAYPSPIPAQTLGFVQILEKRKEATYQARLCHEPACMGAWQHEFLLGPGSERRCKGKQARSIASSSMKKSRTGEKVHDGHFTHWSICSCPPKFCRLFGPLRMFARRVAAGERRIAHAAEQKWRRFVIIDILTEFCALQEKPLPPRSDSQARTLQGGRT